MKNIFNILKDKNLTISFAESMTGGYLSSKLTKINGASKVFKGSIIAYSNEIKIKLLNVSKDTIEKHSVVSSQVANEMAYGLKDVIDSDIYVAITGNAGPTLEANTNKLICYITVLYKEEVINHIEIFNTNKRFSNIKRVEKVVKNIVYNVILWYNHKGIEMTLS